jgi:hypothetical protein
MPPTGSSWIAVVRWCVPVRRACRTGTVSLAVELVEGHGAGGEREPGRDARMPPGSRTGLRDGRAAGRVPADPGWPGEAKISGRAIYARSFTDGSDRDRFYADIAEVVHTHLNEKATMLVVEWWTPAHGLRRIERK